MPKVFRDRYALKEALEREKEKGKVVVLANGAFDLFHVGHLRYLKGAKEKGDILVVAVNSDESVRRNKGPGRPIIPLEERIELLENLGFVDYIIPFDEPTVDELLNLLKPHVHAKGTDYTEETVPERETVLSYGGSVAIVGDEKRHSSTEISQRFWRTIEEDGIELLKKLISIDTTNPPGNTSRAVELLRDFLVSEGFQVTTKGISKNKQNLLIVYKGRGLSKPILLLSHLDVVPADPSKWEVDPFIPVEKDGYLYGRGAIDMKGMAVVELMGLVALKRLGITPSMDIVFAATCDEEVGGGEGVGYLLDKEPIFSEVGFVLNEGGYIVKDKGKVLRYEVSTDQKCICQYRLRFFGETSHGSIPPLDSAPRKMIQALSRIMERKVEPRYLPLVRDYLKKVYGAEVEDGEELPEKLFLDPVLRSMTRDTEEFTVFKGGDKVNTVPGEVSVSVDARLLPGTDPEVYLREIETMVEPYGGKVERIYVGGKVKPTPTETPYMRAIEVLRDAFDPGVPVVCSLLTGATDSRYFRERGVICYDFVPLGIEKEDFLRIHSHNERVSLEDLKRGFSMMFFLLKEISKMTSG